MTTPPGTIRASSEEIDPSCTAPSGDQKAHCDKPSDLPIKPNLSPGERKPNDSTDDQGLPAEYEHNEASPMPSTFEDGRFHDKFWTWLKHEDHWDRLHKDPPLETDLYDWNNEAYCIPFTDWTNKQLHAREYTRRWQQKLSNLRLDMLPALDAVGFDEEGDSNHFDGEEEDNGDEDDEEVYRIPLFEDKIGNQYQLDLTHGTSLNRIACPKLHHFKEVNSTIIFQLRSRLPAHQTSQATTFPRLVMALGDLVVSTPDTRRFHPLLLNKVDRVIDITNYEVLVDLENEDMPLWVVAPRRFLARNGWGWALNDENDTFQQIPIFDGLLADGDQEKLGYDAACFVSSIRKLRPGILDSQKASYEEACELVGKTRVAIDPGAASVSRLFVKEVGSRQARARERGEELPQEETGCDLTEEKQMVNNTLTGADDSNEFNA